MMPDEKVSETIDTVAKFGWFKLKSRKRFRLEYDPIFRMEFGMNLEFQ